MAELPDRPELPERPLPLDPWSDRVRSWLSWVGPGRVAAGAVTVLAVLAAAYWLVRPPQASTESALPFASTSLPTTTRDGSVPASADAVMPSSTVGEVVVHIAGAVVSSGVYRLPPGSRVIDAITTAGGLAPDAEPDAVNLAAVVADAQRIYVPRHGEPVPVEPGTGAASTLPPGPVDLNRATADELDSLPGVGPATAAAIVAYREQHGPFSAVDDLAQVRGIGPAKLEALRGLVTV
ncbi:MAG: helix-hairpin-helix domain-containing protein [Ilumatobacteraceae bacterium]